MPSLTRFSTATSRGTLTRSLSYGVPDRHHDRLPDNSLDALTAWQTHEDKWLNEARQIDPATIGTAPLEATYAIVREALEGSIAARSCRNELCTVSQMVNGWQIQDSYLVMIQLAGTDAARREALTRWRAADVCGHKTISKNSRF